MTPDRLAAIHARIAKRAQSVLPMIVVGKHVETPVEYPLRGARRIAMRRGWRYDPSGWLWRPARRSDPSVLPPVP